MIDLKVPIRVLVRISVCPTEPSVVDRHLREATDLGLSVMEVGYGTARGDPAY